MTEPASLYVYIFFYTATTGDDTTANTDVITLDYFKTDNQST